MVWEILLCFCKNTHAAIYFVKILEKFWLGIVDIERFWYVSGKDCNVLDHERKKDCK